MCLESVVAWREAPATWTQAAHDWLATQTSEHTRRAYATALRQFVAFRLQCDVQLITVDDSGSAQLWHVTTADVVGWQQSLRARRLSAATVNARLLALSSFINFCVGHMAIVDQAWMTTHPLLHHNPVEQIAPLPVPTAPRPALSVAQVRVLLGACDQMTVVGARDFALLATHLLTGQYSSSVRTLRWGDLRGGGGDVLVTWTHTDGCTQEEFLHPAVYAAICHYLIVAGRWERIRREEFLFTPLSDAARRFPHVDTPDLTQPLSQQRVNTIIKGRARAAGLDPRLVTTRTLRRTAVTQLVKSGGARLDELARILHHNSVRTTRAYLSQPQMASSQLWTSVGAAYGL